MGSLMHLLPAQLQRALQLTLVNSLQQHHSSQMLLDTSAGLSALSVPHSAPYLMQVTILPKTIHVTWKETIPFKRQEDQGRYCYKPFTEIEIKEKIS